MSSFSFIIGNGSNASYVKKTCRSRTMFDPLTPKIAIFSLTPKIAILPLSPKIAIFPLKPKIAIFPLTPKIAIFPPTPKIAIFPLTPKILLKLQFFPLSSPNFPYLPLHRTVPMPQTKEV